MAYEIFTVSGSPRSWRVLLACVVKGVAFETRLMSFGDGELKSESFLALNPRGRVPVLRDGDFVLSESIAILGYLERKHPTPALIGEDARATARIWQATMEADHDLREASHAVLFSVLAHNADGAGDDLRKAADRLHQEHARLEARLSGSIGLAGDAISLADIVAFPEIRLVLRACERAPDAMTALGLRPYAQRYPKLAAWVARIEALPGYERTYPPHWRAAA